MSNALPNDLPSNFKDHWTQHQKQITECNQCSRLRSYCKKIAAEKRKAYRNETYWGKPVPGFGDLKAKFLIIGLAPAAHGANRTGRMFTGDQSGLWLYRALHKAGFANQAEATSIQDGLTLKNAYITAVAHCAPPDNKPSPDEIKNCTDRFLTREMGHLINAKVYLCLGKVSYDQTWSLLKKLKIIDSSLKKPEFKHGLEVNLGPQILLCSYHPSQQNTFTKKLTEPMFDSVFERARLLIK